MQRFICSGCQSGYEIHFIIICMHIFFLSEKSSLRRLYQCKCENNMDGSSRQRWMRLVSSY